MLLLPSFIPSDIFFFMPYAVYSSKLYVIFTAVPIYFCNAYLYVFFFRYSSRELRAWRNEINSISLLINIDRSTEVNKNENKDRELLTEQERILLNSMIDPSDPDSPFVWLELRRHFLDYSR